MLHVYITACLMILAGLGILIVTPHIIRSSARHFLGLEENIADHDLTKIELLRTLYPSIRDRDKKQLLFVLQEIIAKNLHEDLSKVALDMNLRTINDLYNLFKNKKALLDEFLKISPIAQRIHLFLTVAAGGFILGGLAIILIYVVSTLF